MHLYELLRKEPGGVNNVRERSDSLRLEANTSGTRLLNLQKKRLVERMMRRKMEEGSGHMRKYRQRWITTPEIGS